MSAVEYIKSIGYTPGKWINKFGRASEISTAPTTFDVWDAASISGAAIYTYDDSAITLYASADSGTLNQEVEIEGLDADWNWQTATATLDGQNQVPFEGTWRRVFRAGNNGGTAFPAASHVYIALADSMTGGVPDTKTNIRAVIHESDEQTLMATYTIPNGHVGFLVNYYSSLLRIGQPSRRETSVKIKVRENGKTFKTKHWIDYSTDTGLFNMPIEPPMFIPSRADVKMTIVNMSDDTDISGGFNLILAR